MVSICLEWLSLAYNDLSVRVDLTSLPKSLKSLRLNSNQFIGSIDLTMLLP